MDTPTIATVVFPAREFEAGVNAWTSVFGTGPTFSSSGQQTAPGEADFAVFKTPDIEIALTSLPWVDEPLLFLDTADIEQTRQALVDSRTAREVADGSLAELGSAPITNGAPRRGSSRSPGPGSPSFGSPTGTSSAFASRCPSPGDLPTREADLAWRRLGRFTSAPTDGQTDLRLAQARSAVGPRGAFVRPWEHLDVSTNRPVRTTGRRSWVVRTRSSGLR